MSQSLDSLLQVEKEFLAQNFTQIKIEENDFYGIFEQSTKSLFCFVATSHSKK